MSSQQPERTVCFDPYLMKPGLRGVPQSSVEIAHDMSEALLCEICLLFHYINYKQDFCFFNFVSQCGFSLGGCFCIPACHAATALLNNVKTRRREHTHMHSVGPLSSSHTFLSCTFWLSARQ